MVCILEADRPAFKRHRLYPTITVVPFIDTMVFRVPTQSLAPAEWGSLVDAYGGPLRRVRNQFGIGIVGQCPQPDFIVDASRIMHRHGGTLSRLDIAYEAQPNPDMTSAEQLAWINAHLVMKGRDAGPILVIDNSEFAEDAGSIWTPHAHLNGSPRDCVTYHTLPSKADPSRPTAAKFEPRKRTRRGIGDKYTDDPASIIHANPLSILNEDFEFVEYDERELDKRIAAEVMRYGRPNDMRKAIAEIRRANQFQYAQRIQDRYRRMNVRNVDWKVRIPERLAWGAQRRATHEKDVEADV